MKELYQYILEKLHLKKGMKPMRHHSKDWGTRMTKDSKRLYQYWYNYSADDDRFLEWTAEAIMNNVFYTRNGGKQYITQATNKEISTEGRGIYLNHTKVTIWGPDEITFMPDGKKQQSFTKYTEWELAFLDYITDKYNIQWEGFKE